MENVYEIKYNDGAIQRRQVEDKILEFEGDREYLMERLDDMYVDCTLDDLDTLIPFDKWEEIYLDLYDISGSNVIIYIKENGKYIFKNEYFMEQE